MGVSSILYSSGAVSASFSGVLAGAATGRPVVIDSGFCKLKVYNSKIGMDTLKRIAVESENERSREESMDLLVDLLLKVDNQKVTIEEQHKIWSEFVDENMHLLDSDNEVLVSNTLQLLSKFLDRYEGKKTLKPEMKQTGFGNF